MKRESFFCGGSVQLTVMVLENMRIDRSINAELKKEFKNIKNAFRVDIPFHLPLGILVGNNLFCLAPKQN